MDGWGLWLGLSISSVGVRYGHLELELALLLTQICTPFQELIEENSEEAARRRSEIPRRLAFHQFTQYKFEESLKNYLVIKEGEKRASPSLLNLLFASFYS